MTSTTVRGSAARIPYNPALDGLRAVAVAMVIASHAGFEVSGWLGVTLFFSISGYLITSLLLAEHDAVSRMDLPHFYWRRAARLMPALLVALAATVGWCLLCAVPVGQWWAGAVGGLTYTTDLIETIWGDAAVSRNFTFTWSLGVEELFYLFWPLLLIGLTRLRDPRIAALAILFLALMPRLVRFPWFGSYLPNGTISFSPQTNADALLFGCLVAFLIARFPTSRALRAAVGGGAPLAAFGLIAIFTRNDGFMGFIEPDNPRMGTAAILSAVLVAACALWPADGFGQLFRIPPLAFLGKLSYSLYLWNILSVQVCEYILGQAPRFAGWGAVLWLAALLGVAWMSYRFVETPLRRALGPGGAIWRRRYPADAPLTAAAD